MGNLLKSKVLRYIGALVIMILSSSCSDSLSLLNSVDAAESDRDSEVGVRADVETGADEAVDVESQKRQREPIVEAAQPRAVDNSEAFFIILDW